MLKIAGLLLGTWISAVVAVFGLLTIVGGLTAHWGAGRMQWVAGAVVLAEFLIYGASITFAWSRLPRVLPEGSSPLRLTIVYGVIAVGTAFASALTTLLAFNR